MRVPQEILSWLATFMLFVTMFIFGMWNYNNNTSTDFNSNVHTVIQDNGGLTPHAQELIQEISKTTYHNHFRVVTEDGNDTGDVVDYGKPITYQIQASIPLTQTYMTHFNQHWQTTSLVRPNSQS